MSFARATVVDNSVDVRPLRATSSANAIQSIPSISQTITCSECAQPPCISKTTKREGANSPEEDPGSRCNHTSRPGRMLVKSVPSGMLDAVVYECQTLARSSMFCNKRDGS